MAGAVCRGFAEQDAQSMCPAYIAGLIGPGDRKSVQPMAARNDEVSYDRLHHFIGSGIWDEAPLEMALLAEADRQVGSENAWLIIDDTALPKKGRHSVGVAPQHASALGKNANCQTLVSQTLASGEVPVMVGLRLFLPRVGRAMWLAWNVPEFPRISGPTEPSRRLRWPRSTGFAQLASASAASLPTQDTAFLRRSGRA
jgi:SRSO17 transposase